MKSPRLIWQQLRRHGPAGSFRRQIVVLTASVTGFSMILLTVVLQLVLSHLASRDVDRVLDDRADAVISSAKAASKGHDLTVPDSNLDAGVAVYGNHGVLVAGSAPAALLVQYDRLSESKVSRIVHIGDSSRVQAKQFRTSGGAKGIVVVTERLQPYEEGEHLALIVSIVTGLLTTVAAACIAAWVTHRALRPVAVMARTAHDWSEHDLGQRFDLGPGTNEITALGGTLDTLLDRVSAAIRSEQRLTAELAHELRTPLTAVQGTADLALLRKGIPADLRTDLEHISSASHTMAETIRGLLELARTEASPARTGTCALDAVVASVLAAVPHDRIAMAEDITAHRLAVPHHLAVRTIAPVVENAVRIAHSSVRISTGPVRSGLIEVFVDDDGPGVAADLEELIFEPGHTSGNGSGAGLGLALSRRIARSLGGDVRLDEAQLDQTRFVLRLPRA